MVKKIYATRQDVEDFLNNHICYDDIINKIEKDEWCNLVSELDDTSLCIIWELFWYIDNTDDTELIIK